MGRILFSLVIAAIFILSRFIWFFYNKTKLNMFFDLTGTLVIAIILFIASYSLLGKIDRN